LIGSNRINYYISIKFLSVAPLSTFFHIDHQGEEDHQIQSHPEDHHDEQGEDDRHRRMAGDTVLPDREDLRDRRCEDVNEDEVVQEHQGHHHLTDAVVACEEVAFRVVGMGVDHHFDGQGTSKGETEEGLAAVDDRTAEDHPGNHRNDDVADGEEEDLQILDQEHASEACALLRRLVQERRLGQGTLAQPHLLRHRAC